MQQAGAQPPRGFTETMSQTTGQLKDQAADRARAVAEQARSAADRSKDQLAQRIGDVAQAIHRTSEQLRSEQQDTVGQYTDAIADQIDRFAHFLQSRDVRSMFTEFEGFARRQPALFLGGAFTLGLVAARFLKSSAREGASQVEGEQMYGQTQYGQSESYGSQRYYADYVSADTQASGQGQSTSAYQAGIPTQTSGQEVPSSQLSPNVAPGGYTQGTGQGSVTQGGTMPSGSESRTGRNEGSR